MDHSETIDEFTMDRLRDAEPGQEIFLSSRWNNAYILRPWLPCLRLDNSRPTLLFLGAGLADELENWPYRWRHRDSGWLVPESAMPYGEFVAALGKALHDSPKWFEARAL